MELPRAHELDARVDVASLQEGVVRRVGHIASEGGSDAGGTAVHTPHTKQEWAISGNHPDWIGFSKSGEPKVDHAGLRHDS
jgi:hypothetical protein